MAVSCSKRQQIGMAVGVSLGCIVLLGVIAVPVVYMRRQWARAEENKLRLTARMSGLDESEVRSEVGIRRRHTQTSMSSACPMLLLMLLLMMMMMSLVVAGITVLSLCGLFTVAVFFQSNTVTHSLTMCMLGCIVTTLQLKLLICYIC